MAETTGMNKILCDTRGIEKVQNPPTTPIQNFGIFEGSEEEGRDYDIPTTQATANGLTLYYTPAVQKPSPASKPSGKRKRAPPTVAPAAEEGHRGLGPLDALPVSPQVVISHGGGRGIRQPGFVHFASGIARAAPVLCFRKDRRDGADDLQKRTAAFHYFLHDAYTNIRALGGRSFGGRCATRASVYSQNRNLILWSYPMVREKDVRSQELLTLPADTRVLFIRGTEDFMAPELIFGPVRQQMKAKSWQIKVKDMDHGFKCDSALQEEKLCSALGVIAGIWLEGDVSDPNNPIPWDHKDGTEMAMHYDAKEEKAVWTGWSRAEE